MSRCGGQFPSPFESNVKGRAKLRIAESQLRLAIDQMRLYGEEPSRRADMNRIVRGLEESGLITPKKKAVVNKRRNESSHALRLWGSDPST